MRNNVSSTSLKSLLESYDRDAAASGRKKISTAGSTGVSGMKSSASTLASAIPEKTVVPEISAADAKSLMNAYYKPMLHEAKEAAAAEKKAQAEAKKASKKKSSSISIDDPNADGPADDFWSNTGKSDNKDNSAKPGNNSNSKPEKEEDKEKKPGLIARDFGALGSLLSAKNDGENSYLENGYKQDTEKNEKKLKNEDKAEKLRELNRKQAKGREESRAARETNAGLLNKSKLNDSEKAEIYTRVNTWAENPENKSLMTALQMAKTKNRVGDLLEAGYTSQQLDEANEMLELYQKMGKGQVLKERVGGTAKGTVKTVASAGMMGADTAMQTAENAVASVKDEEYRNAVKQYNDALLKTQTMEDSNTAYTLDENGNTVQTEEYQKAWQQLNDARAVMDRKNSEINAPVSKDSSGYKMYQSAQEDLARSDLGLDAGTKMLKGAATSAAENIAIAAVNPALVLPVLSAQGAAGGMANSIEKEAPAVNTLANGAAKFMAGWAINSVGVEQMLDTMGASGARNTIAAQIVQSIKNNSKLAQTNPAFYAVLMGAGDNGLQSFAETWADLAIDLATNTAEPMSLQELAAQSLQEAASGALGGAMTAVAGLGVNAGRQAMNNAQNAQAAQYAAETADNATGDNLSPIEQTANDDLTYGLLDNQFRDTNKMVQPTDYDLLPVDETSVNDNPNTHTDAQMNRINDYKQSVDTDMVNFIENVRSGNYTEPYVVSETNDRMRSAMMELTGMDKVGDVVLLDKNGVKHIDKRHGENGQHDKTMSKTEDMARAAYVLQNFDNAYLSKDRADGYTTKNGKLAPIVIFDKKIDGTHIVVEAVSDSKKGRNFIVSEYLSKNGVDKQKIARELPSSMDAGNTDPRATPEALASTTLANQSLAQEVAPVNEDLLTYGLLDSQYAEPAAEQHHANDNYDLLLDGWNYENSQPLAEERGQLDYGEPVGNIANPNTLDNDEIAWNEQRVNDFLTDSDRLSNEEKLAELGNLGIMNDLIHNENELNGVMELLESGASGAYINEYIAQNATDSEKIQFITGKTVRSGVGKALLGLLSNSGSMTNEEFSKAAYDIAEQVEPRSNYHSMNARYKHQWDDVTWRYAVDTIVSKISQMAGRGDGGYGANTVGAAESKFDRSTAPNLDIAEQTGIQNQLNDAAQNAYGESNQLQHDVYSHKQGEYEAAMNLDLSVSEAGGDTNAGINNEVKRLTDVAQWNAEDQYSAKEVRNRILQQLNRAAESGEDTAELVARLHAVDDLISMKRSQIGQALEAGKEAALSSENVSQKFSQYKQEQAQKFANKDKNAAKTMEEIASEISDADLSGQQKDFILDFIKERAKAKNVDMTDAQAEKLAQMVQMGAKTEQFYNTILEFATGIDDLSLDQIEQIDNLIYEAEQLPENSRDRVEKEKQVYAIMASTVKAGFMDKVNAWRYFAMLGNTRTHARNIIGNEAMGLVTGAKDVTATLIEHAVIRDKNDRTKAVLLPTKADNELLSAAYKYANESRYRQLTDNSRFNVKSGIEGEKTVFKNRVTEKARLANNAGLEESDYSGTFGELAVIKEIGGKPGEWAGKIMEKANKAGENGKVGFAGLRAQFARSMAQQMKAKGISADILTSTDPKDIAIVERMADTAVADAQRATFHEDSNTASWLSDKNKPAWVRILTDAELPFTKTPINIVKQAARYSPMGIVKTATVDAYNLSKGNITINKFVDNLAMGLTGTGIALAGAWLADSGILFVPDKDDKKQSFNEMQGKQGYSIIIDGKSYTIDWLAPAALPLLMGASIAKEAKQEGFGFDNIADSISSLADPMIETTMLSSLSDTLESIRYSESGSGIFSTLLVGGATNYAGQFVPTALGQVARSQDEHRRSNKSFASSKTGKQAEYFMRKQINKIPGLGEALDDLDLYENADYVDAWGRKQENGGLAYNALSPGYLRDVDTTRADQYIDDLYNEVGSEAVLPNVSSSKADVDLTPDSYEKYATEKGQTQAALIDELAGQEYISDMPAEVQKKIVSDLYSVAKMAGNKSVDPLWESDSKSDQKLYGIYEDLGESGLVNYVAGSKAFAEIKSSDNPAETAELYSGILDELTPEMVGTYMSDDYKKPYQAYKEGGIKAMAAYERASDRYSEINDNGGKYVDAVLSLDDITPAEQGYIYMLHASKDAKVKFLTQHYSKNMAYKLSYWFMRYSAIEDKLKAQIKGTNIKLSAAREAWANQYISNEQERESFIYLYKTARKDWKFE
uniref:Nuclease n=1 Tax=Myoviridae sp. ctuev19 TaxID=2827716 RepID=A0A8S5SFF7_9CAUD|nr:MAG TPA: nuclease [Myoviridae sp. ctuev19]